MRILFNQNTTPNNMSFNAMKKNQFSGIDRYVVERYKLPIEKFDDMGDFFTYCGNEVEDLKKKDFSGRQRETQVQRKAMLDEWFNYVTEENDAYTKSMEMMILKGITNKLKPKEDKLPPVLNKGVLAETVEQTQKELEQNPKAQFDFDKNYRLNLQKEVVTDYGVPEDMTGWVVIPSQKHDPENFEANVEKLKTLSHPNWCTKSFNAEPYLSKGDFHVYLENGKPSLGVRFYGDMIYEIQSQKNDNRIPVRYFNMMDYFKQYKLMDNARHEIHQLNKAMKKVKKIFPRGLEKYSSKQIFKRCGIDCKEDKDGLLIIKELKKPEKIDSFWEIGADLNKMLKDVKEVEGNADFGGADTFGNIRKIGGHANIYNTGINNLGKLEYVAKGVSYNDINENQKKLVKELKPRMVDYINKNIFPDGIENYSTKQILESFGIECKEDKSGMLTINRYNQPIENFINFSDLGVDENNLLKDVKEIEDLANFRGSNATSLGNVKRTGGGVILTDSNIRDISSIDYAAWNITYDPYLPKITIKDIDEVKNRTRKTFMKEHFPKGINKYKTHEILEVFGIKTRTILFGKNAGKLVISHYRSPINPNLNLKAMGINEDEMFKEIVEIKKHAIFTGTNVTDLGSVEKIGEDAYFSGSNVRRIPNLKYIGGDLKFNHSYLKPEDFSGMEVKGDIKHDLLRI